MEKMLLTLFFFLAVISQTLASMPQPLFEEWRMPVTEKKPLSMITHATADHVLLAYYDCTIIGFNATSQKVMYSFVVGNATECYFRTLSYIDGRVFAATYKQGTVFDVVTKKPVVIHFPEEMSQIVSFPNERAGSLRLLRSNHLPHQCERRHNVPHLPHPPLPSSSLFSSLRSRTE